MYTGLGQGIVQIARTEGFRAIWLGVMPTFVGYSVQGAFKFGFFEFFKQMSNQVIDNPELVSRYKLPIYMSASAGAETLATIALCPFEAIRIKMVAQPEYARMGMSFGLVNILRTEGLIGWYKGLVPILLKQVPYTVVQLTTFQLATDFAYKSLPYSKNELSVQAKLSVTLTCGALAGMASALASHPADTVLTKVNTAPGGTIAGVIRQLGWRGVWLGVAPRVQMVTLLSVVMFLINDSVKVACGLPITASLDKDTH